MDLDPHPDIAHEQAASDKGKHSAPAASSLDPLINQAQSESSLSRDLDVLSNPHERSKSVFQERGSVQEASAIHSANTQKESAGDKRLNLWNQSKRGHLVLAKGKQPQYSPPPPPK